MGTVVQHLQVRSTITQRGTIRITHTRCKSYLSYCRRSWTWSTCGITTTTTACQCQPDRRRICAAPSRAVATATSRRDQAQRDPRPITTTRPAALPTATRPNTRTFSLTCAISRIIGFTKSSSGARVCHFSRTSPSTTRSVSSSIPGASCCCSPAALGA